MLWLVEIHPDDFEYDHFVSAVVWAETAEDAELMIRAKYASEDWGFGLPKGVDTRLSVRLAPAAGVVHTHWHAG